jgi:hypothetical protein
MAVERRLNRLIQKFKYGKHEGSVMTAPPELKVHGLEVDRIRTLTDILDIHNA